MWQVSRKSHLVFPVIYSVAIIIGMLFAFPMERDSSAFFSLLIILTLPWSVVSLPIMFAIETGFDNEVGVVTFTITALLNAFLIYLLCRKLKARCQN